MFGNLTLKFDYDNSITMDSDVYHLQEGSYEKMIYKLHAKPLCDLLYEDTYFYEHFAAVSDFSYPFQCPLRQVRYKEIEINLILFFKSDEHREKYKTLLIMCNIYLSSRACTDSTDIPQS